MGTPEKITLNYTPRLDAHGLFHSLYNIIYNNYEQYESRKRELHGLVVTLYVLSYNHSRRSAIIAGTSSWLQCRFVGRFVCRRIFTAFCSFPLVQPTAGQTKAYNIICPTSVYSTRYVRHVVGLLQLAGGRLSDGFRSGSRAIAPLVCDRGYVNSK